MEFGILIKKERIKAGLSQEFVSTYASISQTKLSRIESGTAEISAKELLAIANTLMVSIYHFFPNEKRAAYSRDLENKLAEMEKELLHLKEYISHLEEALKLIKKGYLKTS